MIEKIVVSRTSAVSHTVLKAATKLDLETGGWLDDDADLMAAFHLKRVGKASSSSGLEQAVSASQGTLYFTTGKEIGAASRFEKLKRCALRLNRPLLVVDLDDQRGFSASRRVSAWIAENAIRVLHVDGSCGGQVQAGIHKSIADILEAAYFLGMTQLGLPSAVETAARPGHTAPTGPPPETVKAALDHLENGMSLKDKAAVANMSPGELAALDSTLGGYIRSHFGLFTEGSQLLADCRRRNGTAELSPDHAAAVIIEKLWERLRATCRIRVVK